MTKANLVESQHVVITTSSSPPVLAYFFPLNETDPHRLSRGKKYGVLNNKTDLELAQQAGKTYCLGDNAYTKWDDSDPAAIQLQLALAREYGLSGFIVDTYVGSQKGEKVEELDIPLKYISTHAHNEGMKFCSMFCLKLPRAVLPIKNGLEEQNRWLDFNNLTAEYIIDKASSIWNKEGYLIVNDKPYVSIYGMLNYPGLTSIEKKLFIAYLRSYAYEKYNTELFLVGVGQTPQDIVDLEDIGFDASTQYAGLPDFSSIKSLAGAKKFNIATNVLEAQDHQIQMDKQLLR